MDQDRLAGHQGAEIVTFHEAFGYFVEEFGIEVVGSVRPGDASAPRRRRSTRCAIWWPSMG
ncbi:MAG: hypothetical protein R3D59_15540 [Paracoccaceae bacterium]